MPTIVPFTCYNSSQSGETALPRPYPCCGWKVPPASFSGTYRCISAPMMCGSYPTVATSFTLAISDYCGSIHTYSSLSLPFYIVLQTSLCTEPTGAVPPGSVSIGLGPMPTITSPATCSVVSGVYNFSLGGTVQYGSATLEVIVNQVTP